MSPVELLLLLVAGSVAGGLLPLLVRDSPRLLHLLLCLAAGFFLGVVFLHLLPELTHEAASDRQLWGWVLVGLLGVLVLDLGIFGKQSHAAVGWATLLGLTVHALAMGLSLGVLERVDLLVAWAILPHKFGESFSLTSALRFTLRSRAAIFWILCLFSAVTPLGMLAGVSLHGAAGSEIAPIVSAIAAGSFLYVAVGDLLPEVFHESEDRGLKLLLLLAGVGFAALTSAPDYGAGGVEGGLPAWLWHWLESFWSFFSAAAPYLLLGFAVAALVRAFLPAHWLAALLGRDDLGSVLRASAIGAPLPLCSCSVLPAALSLHERGASKGATVAFLVSTPETGIDSIGVTWALMDPAMTLARPVGAVLSATVAGIATNLLAPGEGPAKEVDADATCGGTAHEAAALVEPEHEPAAARLRAALRFAYVDMFDDIMPSLLLGTAVAAAVLLVLPGGFFDAAWASGLPGLGLAAAAGIPLYVCASGSTPIAVALILKGLSPGAALVFLLVGPATNLGSLFALARVLGGKVVATYLAALVVSAILLGALLDAFYDLVGKAPAVHAAGEAAGGSSALGLASAVVLGALCLMTVWRRGHLQQLFTSDRRVPAR